MTTPSIRSALDNVSVDRIREHIQELEGIRHPIANPEALDRAAAYVHASLQALGYEISEHRFKEGDREFQNIIATCSGIRYPEERVIVLAHYDTVSTTPGADDNASGVAVLLELATVLRSIQFDRSFQFIAVNLEEADQEGAEDSIMTRGSRALAEHARENAWNIAGVVVLEMVAYAGGSIPQKVPGELPIQVPEFGDFIGIAGNQDSAELVRAFTNAIERYDIPLPCVPFIVPGNGEMLPDTRRSDHAPFWDNGYRAVMLTDTAEFRNPHYHRMSDTLETLNLPFAANVCRAIGGLVADMAGYLDQT
jgi:Zn-dependent M28 family amino/carboxypeptidase